MFENKKMRKNLITMVLICFMCFSMLGDLYGLAVPVTVVSDTFIGKVYMDLKHIQDTIRSVKKRESVSKEEIEKLKTVFKTLPVIEVSCSEEKLNQLLGKLVEECFFFLENPRRGKIDLDSSAVEEILKIIPEKYRILQGYRILDYDHNGKSQWNAYIGYAGKRYSENIRFLDKYVQTKRSVGILTKKKKMPNFKRLSSIIKSIRKKQSISETQIKSLKKFLQRLLAVEKYLLEDKCYVKKVNSSVGKLIDTLCYYLENPSSKKDVLKPKEIGDILKRIPEKYRELRGSRIAHYDEVKGASKWKNYIDRLVSEYEENKDFLLNIEEIVMDYISKIEELKNKPVILRSFISTYQSSMDKCKIVKISDQIAKLKEERLDPLLKEYLRNKEDVFIEEFLEWIQDYITKNTKYNVIQIVDQQYKTYPGVLKRVSEITRRLLKEYNKEILYKYPERIFRDSGFEYTGDCETANDVDFDEAKTEVDMSCFSGTNVEKFNVAISYTGNGAYIYNYTKEKKLGRGRQLDLGSQSQHKMTCLAITKAGRVAIGFENGNIRILTIERGMQVKGDEKVLEPSVWFKEFDRKCGWKWRVECLQILPNGDLAVSYVSNLRGICRKYKWKWGVKSLSGDFINKGTKKLRGSV